MHVRNNLLLLASLGSALVGVLSAPLPHPNPPKDPRPPADSLLFAPLGPHNTPDPQHADPRWMSEQQRQRQAQHTHQQQHPAAIPPRPGHGALRQATMPPLAHGYGHPPPHDPHPPTHHAVPGGGGVAPARQAHPHPPPHPLRQATMPAPAHAHSLVPGYGYPQGHPLHDSRSGSHRLHHAEPLSPPPPQVGPHPHPLPHPLRHATMPAPAHGYGHPLVPGQPHPQVPGQPVRMPGYGYPQGHPLHDPRLDG